MSFARVIAASGALAAILSAGPAASDEVKTPECQRDLAAAVQLINAIQAREKRFVRGDMARNCQLLQQNLADMVKAREPMDRCLSGHEHGETTGQLDASLEDIRAVLAGNCQK
ncbi:MAG TPA: hypothetical protein VFC56_20245 [Stellaceae bacterium]|nr:hypothetical protein [Stellaceae bacterium]